MDNLDRFLERVLTGIYVLLIAATVYCLVCSRLQDPSTFGENVLFLLVGAQLVIIPLFLCGGNGSKSE